MPKRRHNSDIGTACCRANATNSSRSDTRVDSFQDIDGLDHPNSRVSRCYLCPGTSVTHVSGPYTDPKESNQRKGSDENLAAPRQVADLGRGCVGCTFVHRTSLPSL